MTQPDIDYVIEHERDEQWAYPKGMKDPEYGVFLPGATRGREPYADGKWHIILTARAIVGGKVFERKSSWIERPDMPARGNGPWAHLDRQINRDVAAALAEGLIAAAAQTEEAGS